MVKPRQVIAVLDGAGFAVTSQVGSHVKLSNGTNIAIVPNHPGRDIRRGTLRSILQQANMSEAEFLRRLKG
jgi:predicted RNA binding protein YcfA (HicA-like mRNA interferase family)